MTTDCLIDRDDLTRLAEAIRRGWLMVDETTKPGILAAFRNACIRSRRACIIGRPGGVVIVDGTAVARVPAAMLEAELARRAAGG